MTTLLVDGTNCVMRALHAGLHGAMATSTGVDTAGLTIFVGLISKLVRDEAPDRLGIAWDSPAPGFRHRLHPDYKAKRTPSPVNDAKESTFALVKRFCALAGIHHIEYPEAEADDVVASWWHDATDGPIVIASSDKDFLQMTGPNPHGVDTVQVRFSGDETDDRWDSARVAAQHCAPEHWAAMTALSGDLVDNIPGIRGIGPVKARKLLASADWSLGRVLESYPDQREQVEAFHRMVDLRHTRLPVGVPPPMALTHPDSAAYPALQDFLRRYALSTVARRLAQGSLWRPVPYRHAVRPGRLADHPERALGFGSTAR